MQEAITGYNFDDDGAVETSWKAVAGEAFLSIPSVQNEITRSSNLFGRGI